MNKYWPNEKSIKLKYVANKLEELSKKQEMTKDRIKLAFVYLVAGFLLSGDVKRTIDSCWLQYANDLNFFNRYPWGKYVYNKTLEYIKTDLKNKQDTLSYNLYGCPWILQVWALEVMPKLGEMMTTNKNNRTDHVPRWLRWQNKKQLVGALFDSYLSVMTSDEFIVRPTLTSTLLERQQDFYQQIDKREDQADDVIDCLTNLLVGNVIVCSDTHSIERDECISNPTPLPVATQPHGPTPTTSIPFAPSQDQDSGLLTKMKSMLENQEALIIKKVEAIIANQDKAFMRKIESIIVKQKKRCRCGMDVEVDPLRGGGETNGDNFNFEHNSPHDDQIRDDGSGYNFESEHNLTRDEELGDGGGDNFKSQDDIPQGKEIIDEIRDGGLENFENQYPLREEKTRNDNICGDFSSYVTPLTIYHQKVVGLEDDDVIEEVISPEGRLVRLRKRHQALQTPFTVYWPKKSRYSKCARPTFDPFRAPTKEDKDSF